MLPGAIVLVPIAALTAVAAWRNKRGAPLEGRPRVLAPERRSAWRFVPLGSAIVLTILTVLTFGAGIILTPIATALTAVAFWRARPESLVDFTALSVGGVIVAFYTLGFVLMIGLIVYEQVISA
jgi:hypothetical protein